MPIPLTIYQDFRKIEDDLVAGKVAEAQARIFRAELGLYRLLPSVTPYERLMLSAFIASLLKRCGNWYQAAVRLEKVCDLALELDPEASQTIGDLCDLAECYQKLGKQREALSALQRARPICQRVLPEFLVT